MPQLAPLPIDALLPGLLEALRCSSAAVLTAAPGAGKTTRVPPALALASGMLSAGHPAVAILQPRRVAARASAARIADERGWRLGEEVGYHIRFEKRLGPRTRIRVLTEGILTRQIQEDPFLDGIGCVILDEFHERGIHTDLALALLREVQLSVRPDLKIVVMSATMDPSPVAAFLGDAPVLQSEGRMYPVDVRHAARPDDAWIDKRVLAALGEVLRGRADRVAEGAPDDPGHVLVFLPGIGEIRRVEAEMSSASGDVHVLHSSVPSEMQDRALRPSARRKIILATNIAETSLTIDGVRTVIDSGLARVPVHDPRAGIDRLETRRISRASATQRAGRAGRTAPGICYRLWTHAEDAALNERETPEIHRIDLAPTALTLRAYGTRTLESFGWFEPPRPAALARAGHLLRLLGATATDGSLTPFGRKLADLPLHPRLGRLLLRGAAQGLTREAATLAAALSEDILFLPPAERRREAARTGRSDVLERLESLLNTGDLRQATITPGRDPQSFLRIRDELVRLAERRAQGGHQRSPAQREDALLRLMLDAFPDRVTRRREADPLRGVMVGQRGIVLAPTSVVQQGDLFLSLDPRDSVEVGKTSEAQVSLASHIEESWLAEQFPQLYQQRMEHRYDPQRERVITTRQTLHAELILREEITGAQADPEGASACFRAWLGRAGAAVFAADEGATRLLARWRFLAHQMPELGLPGTEAERMAETLAESAAGLTDMVQLRRAGLKNVLIGALPFRLRSELDRLAPETIQVPSGSDIRLDYGEPSEAPVLPVRLQEMFGCLTTPTVANGRVPVVLHLLAPNYRPVQVTRDLAGFWERTYEEVRKELRARYPKHPWPENPREAPPRAVGGRRRG